MSKLVIISMKLPKILSLCLALLAISCGDREAQIITTAEKIADGEWQCFRKEFFLLTPKSAELKIAADTKYWLWVNGELVVREGGLKRGPNPTDSYCDVFNGIPQLKLGKNTIAILVQYYGKSSFSHSASEMPGIWFDLNTGLDRVVSDKSWKAVRYAPFFALADENPKGVRQYRLAGANVGYDARKAIDFASAEFDDKAWSSAIEVSRQGSEWGEFVERPIPQWRWSELRNYDSCGVAEDGAIECKLPYNAHITPYLKICAKGGEHIKIYTDDYWIGKARSFYTEYIAREGEQEFETPIWVNGHKVLYYVPEGVDVLELKYRESGYDSDFVGSFECDNEFCNRLWEKAKRTLYVTMRDNYMDCPDRERAQWWGDVVVELGETGYLFDERAHLLTRKAILELMNWQRPDGVIYSPIPGTYNQELPCQMLASVGYYGFYTYYMLSGDKQTIEDVYGGVRKYLYEVWNATGTGIIAPRKGGWYWGDWGKNIDKPALQQCWYAVALKGFAKMARLTGHNREAKQAEETLVKLYYDFDLKFWDKKLEYYKSADYQELPDDRVQAMAVLAGLVPEERYPILREFFKAHYNASPYMEKYVLEALCTMGYYEDALIRMEKRFGEMVAAPYSTLWEGWEYTGARGMKYKSGHGTYNHSWSGGGLTILSQYIAGIAPIKPKFEHFSVEPNLASLNYVKSVVPTVYGNIELHAEKGSDALTIELTVPDSTTAEVRLPKGYSSLECGELSEERLTLHAGKHKIIAKR